MFTNAPFSLPSFLFSQVVITGPSKNDTFMYDCVGAEATTQEQVFKYVRVRSNKALRNKKTEDYWMSAKSRTAFHLTAFVHLHTLFSLAMLADPSSSSAYAGTMA